MKDIKKKVEFFTFYDKTGIEKHLEHMAEEGCIENILTTTFKRFNRLNLKRRTNYAKAFYI